MIGKENLSGPCGLAHQRFARDSPFREPPLLPRGGIEGDALICGNFSDKAASFSC
jgi:hypothetical protein